MTKPNFTAENAFARGLCNCRVKDMAAIKREIMYCLDLRNDKAYYNRKFGFVRHSPYERQGIERTFRRYGVNPQTVWGLAPDARQATNSAIFCDCTSQGPATTRDDRAAAPQLRLR